MRCESELGGRRVRMGEESSAHRRKVVIEIAYRKAGRRE